MKHSVLPFFLVLFMACSLHAQRDLFQQRYDEYANFGKTEAELDALKQTGEILVFNEVKHKTKLAKTLFKKNLNKKHKEKTRTGDKLYEVIGRREVPHYRINYIFLDGNKLSSNQVEALLKKIQGMHEEGIKFTSLARQYSMDIHANNGGDSGWFQEAATIPEFFAAIQNSNRLANEVFRVDLPSANWYYLVQKTYSSTSISEILVHITP